MIPSDLNKKSLSEKEWLFLSCISSLLVILATIFCLSSGITTVFMHLYYVPIILLSYHYRARGVAMSVCLGLVYVILVGIFTYPPSAELESAVIRLVVFGVISAVVAWLSTVLVAARKNFEQIFLKGGNAIIVLEGPGMAMRIHNPQADTLFGYSAAEWNQIHIKSLFADPDVGEQFMHALDEQTELRDFESVMVKKDGAHATVLLSATALSGRSIVLTITDITERKGTESHLRDITQLQQSIISNANVWLMVLDGRGKILVWNKAAERISGYTADEVLGSGTIWKLLYPDKEYRQRITKTIQDIIRKDAFLQNFETTIHTKDNARKVLLWNTRGLPGTGGEMSRFVAIGVDITTSVKAEESLRESENRYRTLAETAQDSIFIVGYDGTLEYMNLFGTRSFTGNEHIITGRTIYDIFPADLSGLLSSNIMEVLSTGIPAHFQHRIEQEGSVRWLDTRLVPLAKNAGEKIRLLGISRDISELKSTELALAESEERYRTLVENLPEYVIVYSGDRIIYANPATVRTMGYSREELINSSLFTYLTGASQKRAREMMIRRQQGEPVSPYEIEVVTRSGEVRAVMVHPAASQVLFDGVPGVILVLIDVTEQKKMEERQQRLLAVVESSREFIGIADLDGNVTYINPEGQALAGISAGDVTATKVTDFVLPEDIDLFMTEIMPALNSRGWWKGETQILNVKTGEHIDVDVTTFLIRRPSDDTPYCFATVMHDIRERKRAEEEIKNNNKYLSIINQVISASTSSISVEELLESSLEKTVDLLSFTGGVIYLADQNNTTATLRYSHKLPHDLPESMMTVTIDESDFSPLFRDALPVDIHHLPVQEPGIFPEGMITCTCVPLRVEDRVFGALCVFSRGTDTLTPEIREILNSLGRELGAGLQKGLLQKRLEQLNDDANLYLDIMTHDINNANAGSLGYAEFLIEETSGETKEFARRVFSGIWQSVEIIRNVSTIRKMREKEQVLRIVDLQKVISAETARFPDARITSGPVSFFVLADELMGEIFTNLIGNSAKFGGPDVDIHITAREKEGMIEVSVEDTGPGIADDLKPLIFNRFRKGTSKQSGKGLGLFIARTLVESYGGTIWAEDRVPGTPSMGARISFTIRKSDV